MSIKPAKPDLQNLSVREMVILVVTVLAAVSYGFYQFEYTVQTKKIKQLDQQTTDIQSSIGALKKVLTSPESSRKTEAEIIAVTEELTQLQADIEQAKDRLTGQDLEILNTLQDEADFYGVFLKSIKTRERSFSRAGLRLKEVSLVMEVESDFNALINFVASLKDFPAVISVQSFETSRVEKILPKLDSRLHIKVIVL